MKRTTVITLLAMWTLMVLTAGAGALVIDRAGQDTGTPPGFVPPTVAAPPETPDPPQLRLHGAVQSLDLVGTPAERLAVPLVFTSAEPGSGNGAEIEGVLVGDDIATLVWDAGRPLAVDGDGAFALRAVAVGLVDGELRAALGGTTADILPGAFLVRSPVAVGRGGLAEPRDGVAFVVGAAEAPTISFRGDVTVDLPRESVEIAGPGGLTITGSLSFDRPDGSERLIRRVTVAPDADYRIKVAPLGNGWIVDGMIPADAAVVDQ